MKTKKAREIIHISTREASLKRKLRQHFRNLGFSKARNGAFEIDGDDKDSIRALHRFQRNERLSYNASFLSHKAPDLLQYFATGGEIEPTEIRPELRRVYAQSLQADLFRLAALTWSVPVSNGFGRRLRFLVWDTYNDKIIGLIAVGDPVFNLSVRDDFIGWNAQERGERLVNMMDAYVLGALPPYSMLLGGKMVACLVRSRDIYDEFARTYGSTTGIISGKRKNARLLAATTVSSMGRSSVYNRLKLDGISYFRAIGYTGGWGHFHISDGLFLEMRDYLRNIGHGYADLHEFGHGPNWRLRTTRAALQALGFSNNIIRHGIQRQVFFCNFASNTTNILQTGKGSPELSALLNARDIAELALERWILPRSQRRPEYRSWTKDDLLQRFSSCGVLEQGRRTSLVSASIKRPHDG